MKHDQSSEHALRSLRELENEVKALKANVQKDQVRQPTPGPRLNIADAEKRSRIVNFGKFPQDTKVDAIKQFI